MDLFFRISYMKKTGEILLDASLPEILFSKANGTITKTIDWTPTITINDAKAGAALDYQIKITAKQTGTGDPSPTNIRPISGFTGASISVNGNTVAVSWQTEAGTVYGGVLDVTTGTLTVNKMGFVFDGDENWNIAATGTNRVFRLNSAFNPGIVRARDNTYICNMAILTRQISGIENLGVSYWFFRTTDSTGSSGQFDLLVGTSTDDVNMTIEEFKTMLTSTPMVVVADIQVPVTYTLTPTEITLAEGVNTIWADCGDSKMTYKAGR